MRGVHTLLFLCSLVACTTPVLRPQEIKGRESSLGLPSWEELALSPSISMDKAYFRQHYLSLPEAIFAKKWQDSQKSPLLFFRSYVIAYWAEFKTLRKSGPLGSCFGDAHPENFGWLPFSPQFLFVFNDGDDMGSCPIAFDALRYFTALRLSDSDDTEIRSLLRSYLLALNGESVTESKDMAQLPDWSSLLAKNLAKKTLNRRLLRDADLKEVKAQEIQAIYPAWVKATGFAGKRLDIVRLEVKGGGSAGLLRYILLLEDEQKQLKLIEWKERRPPAVQQGPWQSAASLSQDYYLDKVWQGQRPRDFSLFEADGKGWLARSRIKVDPDWQSMAAPQRLALLKTQVSLIAQLHREQMAGTTEYEDWLFAMSARLAKRWLELREAALACGSCERVTPR